MAFWKAGPIPINTWTACVKRLADAVAGDDRIKSITVAEQGLAE